MAATGGPQAHRLSWWQGCSGSCRAKMQRSLPSRSATLQRNWFLRIMLTAVNHGCTGPHPATHGCLVTLLQEQILQLQAAAQHSAGQAHLDSNDPIFLPPAFTERASSA